MVGNIDPSDELYVIKWCNLYCVMENNRLKYVQMANLPLAQAKFYFEKYKNISRSMFCHWSKGRYEMLYNVKPKRDEVTAVWKKLRIMSLVICTADRIFGGTNREECDRNCNVTERCLFVS
jgi:hypothetical protein